MVVKMVSSIAADFVKAKPTVDDVVRKMEFLARPPLRCNLDYFVSVGLEQEDSNPKKLAQENEVLHSEIVAVFWDPSS